MPDKHIITKDGKWVTVSDDELYHWKYIKREKVNGKWRYYYHEDDKTLKDKLSETADNLKDYAIVQKTRDVLGYDEKAYAEYAKTNADTGLVSSYVVNGKKTTVNWGEEYTKAQEKFLKTPLGKVEQLADVVDKAKDWVSGLFTKKGAPKPTLSDPNGKIIKENVIKENVIKENVIKEKTIPQTTIPQTTINERSSKRTKKKKK